jgi:RimJ/RimL family protein N-acetyltransferase
MSTERSPILITERLILRHWRKSDRELFARLNADPRVMEFMPHALSKEDSDALSDRIEEHFREHGFGLFAVELRRGGSFIGFVGLNVPSFDAPFTPCVEIGWRLAAEYWGQGLATEGAHAIVRYGFETLGLDRLVSFTAPTNARSRRVMEKIGMTHDPADDFDHPRLPAGHPLRPQVLYRLSRSAWNPRRWPMSPLIDASHR